MEPEKKSNGSLVGLIIIVIILIIGGIYIWQSNKNALERMEDSSTITNQDSEELNMLEAEIQTTDTSTGVDTSTIY